MTDQLKFAIFALFASVSVANADVAQYVQQCQFTTECIEQEKCAETDYAVQVSYDFSILDGTTDDGAGSGKAQKIPVGPCIQ